MNHGQYPMMMGYDGAGWHGGVGFHSFFWVVVLAIVIAVGVALVRYLWRSGRGGGDSADALAVLDSRYAKGEIQRDEYLQKKKDLS
jgi:putative membrane protein